MKCFNCIINRGNILQQITDKISNLYFTVPEKYLLAIETKVRPQGYKTFSCSTQLSMKFQLLIKTKIPSNEEVSFFKSYRCCIDHANKC